jgi:AcrR family transcriptional regulator
MTATDRAEAVERKRPTRQRILAAALSNFASRGFEATSLDSLAAAIGVRKQSILYYFPSKDVLLTAVIDSAAADVTAALEVAIAGTPPTAGRVAAIVDAVFRLGADRPELLQLVREITRFGPPASLRLGEQLGPLVERAASFLAAEADGHRPADPDRVVLTAVAMVLGMVTEAELLRSLGVEPDLGWLRRRRRAVLAELGAPSANATPGTADRG